MIERVKDCLFEIISFVVGTLGIIATVTGALANSGKDGWAVYFIVLASESLLVVVWGWNLEIKYLYKKKEKELQDRLNAADDRIKIMNNQIEIYKNGEILKLDICYRNASIIFTNIKKASKLNNELCISIPEINEKSYRTLETLMRTSTASKIDLTEEIKKLCDDFSDGLCGLFNKYSRDLLCYIVNIIEAYLRMHDLSNNVAVTLKLFNKPLTMNVNKDEIKVYTAFRDKRTFEEGKREIGQETYSICGNTDFNQCLTKDYFIINNTTKNDQSYANEHIDFELYYNCAVVVALKIKQTDNTMKYLGYLCCDTLNSDINKDIFDKDVAQLLFAIGQLFSTFLETLNSNWIDRMGGKTGVEEDFLELICKKICK